MEKENQIVRYQSEAIVPRTFDEALAFARALSESDLMPLALRKRAPDVLVIILAGRELGIPPLASTRVFQVIEGIPRLSADGMAAVVQSKPICEFLRLIEQTGTKCTWETKRVGDPPVRSTWTMDMAAKAQLLGRVSRSGAPGNWEKYPHRMLSARAKSDLCRDVYPEIVAGIVTIEELDGEPRHDTVTARFEAPEIPGSPVNEPAKKRTKQAPPPPARVPNLIDDGESDRVDTAASWSSDGTVVRGASEPPPTVKAKRVEVIDVPAPEPEPAQPDEPELTIELFESQVSAATTLADLEKLRAENGVWRTWGKGEGRSHGESMRSIYSARHKQLEKR